MGAAFLILNEGEAMEALIGLFEARWREATACRGEGSETFYGADPGKSYNSRDASWAHTAIAICQSCEVRDRCLEDALERRESYGVWGGLTTTQRQLLLRRRQRREQAGQAPDGRSLEASAVAAQ